MTTVPTTPGPEPKTPSGEHAAADKASAKIGGSTFSWRWSGVARAFMVVVPGLISLIVAFRAPSKGEVKADAKAEATVVASAKAEEVRAATAEPIDDHAVELARNRAELARLATIVSFYENERKTLAADPSQHTPRRKKRGPEIEKKVAAATRDLKLIAARASEPAPLSAPKTLPGDAPKETPPQQQQAAPQPTKPSGAQGGANP